MLVGGTTAAVTSTTTSALVGSTTTTTGSGSTATIIGTGGSNTTSNAAITYGFADHAAAYLKGGVDISALSPADRKKYESYYNTALIKQNTTEAAFITQIATAPLATSTYRTGANVSLYNFDSGVDYSIANPDKGTTRLSNGVELKNYGTATNILEVRNAVSNDLFIADVKTAVGNPYWNTVVIPTYEGTKAAIADQVKNNEVSKDAMAFYQAGLANGSWTETTAGIEKAIANYSAALTLAVIEAPVTNKVVAAGAADGLRGTT